MVGRESTHYGAILLDGQRSVVHRWDGRLVENLGLAGGGVPVGVHLLGRDGGRASQVAVLAARGHRCESRCAIQVTPVTAGGHRGKRRFVENLGLAGGGIPVGIHLLGRDGGCASQVAVLTARGHRCESRCAIQVTPVTAGGHGGEGRLVENLSLAARGIPVGVHLGGHVCRRDITGIVGESTHHRGLVENG